MTKFQIGDKVKFLNSIGGGVVTKITPDFVFVRDDTGFDMPMPPNELIRMADQKGVAKVFNQDVPGELPTAEEARQAVEAESKAAAKEAELTRKLKEKFTGSADDDDVDKLREDNVRLRSQVANLQHQVKTLKERLAHLQSQNAQKLNENVLLQYMTRPGEAEVDLHIEALTDHPERLSDIEKHELQKRFFRTCLNHALLNGFKKVVFIHGVGRGVLKTEIHNELDLYENVQYVDAPMSLYGAGATEVYIKSKK
ncbi:MAG: Smr/MutS family protein [Bacteroidales bacterium]|nr:Smr/MutS family protein [Bacteroidales bacterium]